MIPQTEFCEKLQTFANLGAVCSTMFNKQTSFYIIFTQFAIQLVFGGVWLHWVLFKDIVFEGVEQDMLHIKSKSIEVCSCAVGKKYLRKM